MSTHCKLECAPPPPVDVQEKIVGVQCFMPLKTHLFNHFLAWDIHHYKSFSSSRHPASEKKNIFEAKFLLILAKFQLLRHKFSKNLFPETNFKPQNQFQRLTFENQGSAYLPKVF